MAINYAALKAELQTDPNGYGYAPLWAGGNDAALADMLNLLRDGTNGGPAISVHRQDISSQELLEQIDVRDFINNPNYLWCSWFEDAMKNDRVVLVDDAGADTRVLANLKRILNNTNGSQGRLNAMASKVGSRAEQLFGSGIVLSSLDITQARRA